MNDPLLQLQDEVTARLDYEPAFQNISVKSYRKHLISAEIDKRLPHLAGKNNKIGCGVLVGIPTLEGIDPNVSKPQSSILLPIDIIALPELNNDPGSGTLIEPETVARNARACLHSWQNEGLIFLSQEKQAITPIEGIEQSFPGCIGYRVLLRGRLLEDDLQKLTLPTIQDNGAGTVTLAGIVNGTTVVYTIDGSQPIPAINDNQNPSAHNYTAPFSVSDNTLVRWAAYAPGWISSDYGMAKIHID